MSGGALAVIDAACCVLALDKTADPNRRLEQAREAFAELIEAAELARTELKRQHAYSTGAEAGSIWRALQATEAALVRVDGSAS